MTDDNETQAPTVEMPTRRLLLKRAAIALPVVSTIPSGAALARSSYVISYRPAIYDDANVATYGSDILCLDTSNVRYLKKEYAVDLGPHPNVSVVRLPADADYAKVATDPPVSAAEACEAELDTWLIKPAGTDVWPEDGKPIFKGAVVSAIAISSFVDPTQFTTL